MLASAAAAIAVIAWLQTLPQPLGRRYDAGATGFAGYCAASNEPGVDRSA